MNEPQTSNPTQITNSAINSAQIINFGCRLNAFEGLMMGELLRKDKYAGDDIIINSCAVTSETERQVKQAIRRAKKNNPEKRVVVTGCAAQINPDSYKNMPEVGLVLGNSEKFTPANYENNTHNVSDIMLTRDKATLWAPHLVTESERARFFIMVQQGCDHRCTFCIIPFGRGQNRAVSGPEIMNSINNQIAKNPNIEIVLTGVDIMSYKDENGVGLAGLVREIARQCPQLRFLRLSSLDPAFIDDDFISLFAEIGCLLPSVHLSLQSGSDLILKRMKRRHLRAGASEIITKLRKCKPNISIGADIICGFPTETDELFAETQQFIAQNGVELAHVFPYSNRAGTPAAKIPNQVPLSERKKRAHIIRQTALQNLQNRYMQMVGNESLVLVEHGQTARTAEYFVVHINRPCAESSVQRVKFTGFTDNILHGEII